MQIKPSIQINLEVNEPVIDDYTAILVVTSVVAIGMKRPKFGRVWVPIFQSKICQILLVGYLKDEAKEGNMMHDTINYYVGTGGRASARKSLVRFATRSVSYCINWPWPSLPHQPRLWHLMIKGILSISLTFRTKFLIFLLLCFFNFVLVFLIFFFPISICFFIHIDLQCVKYNPM